MARQQERIAELREQIAATRAETTNLEEANARLLQAITAAEDLVTTLTDEQEKQINFIRTTSEEFADMVNDLLDLAKVEAGRIDVSPGWFELVDLFAALRGMFKPVLVDMVRMLARHVRTVGL